MNTNGLQTDQALSKNDVLV